MVQSNVFQKSFCSFRWKSLYFFFKIRLKVMSSLSRSFQLYQKETFRTVSGFLSFSSNLLEDMGGVEENVLVLWSHWCLSYGDCTAFLILHRSSQGNFSTFHSFWAILACSVHGIQKRCTPAENTTPQVILGLYLGQRLFGRVIFLF